MLEIGLREEVLGSVELGVCFGFVLRSLMAEDREVDETEGLSTESTE